MIYDEPLIIDDLNYSTDDIQELFENKSSSYLTIGAYTSALLLGVCNVSASEIYGNADKLGNDGVPEIEVIFDSCPLMENYEAVFRADDILFYTTENSDVKKRETVEAILSFKSLNHSWDGYGAFPVQIKSAANAIEFLDSLDSNFGFTEPVDVFPNPNGTVSMIWENNNGDRLSAEIGNNEISYYIKLVDTEPKFFSNIEINSKNVRNINREVNALF